MRLEAFAEILGAVVARNSGGPGSCFFLGEKPSGCGSGREINK